MRWTANRYALCAIELSKRRRISRSTPGAQHAPTGRPTGRELGKFLCFVANAKNCLYEGGRMESSLYNSERCVRLRREQAQRLYRPRSQRPIHERPFCMVLSSMFSRAQSDSVCLICEIKRELQMSLQPVLRRHKTCRLTPTPVERVRR